MSLTDLMLKARVNLALARDCRVSSLDIGVTADNGLITLSGDVDTQPECRAAEEISRSVEGVTRVVNDLSCGIGRDQETADLVSQRFLEKLDEEWEALPERTALAQADYLRWALWMIRKFQIPDTTGQEAVAVAQATATEEAIRAVASRIGCPPAWVAFELQQLRDQDSDAPRLTHVGLATSPQVDEGNTELAA